MSRAHVDGVVVVIDTDVALIRSLTATLESRGIVAFSASDGDKAMQLIEERDPAVVVLDIVLPGLNGFQLCRRLSSERPDLPVIFFSVKHQPADKLWAAEVGAVALFRKPNELAHLVDRVAELAGG